MSSTKQDAEAAVLELRHPRPAQPSVPRSGPKNARRRRWNRNGVTLGFWRGPVAWIDRTIHSIRYRVSTGARTAEAAYEEYVRFEKDPANYVPRTERHEGSGWADAVLAFLQHQRNIEGLSDKYVDDLAAQLARWHDFPGFSSLDSFTQSDIESFLTHLVEGKLTSRKVSARDDGGKVIWERNADGSIVLNKKGHRVSKKVEVPYVGRNREASRNRHLAALKSLMTWARNRKPPLTKNDAADHVFIGKEDRDTRPPEPVEKDRWEAAGKHLGDRWLAAQKTLLGSGLRYGELARLKQDDLKPRGIIVRTAKARKGRTIPVSEACVAAATKMLKLGGVPADSAQQMDDRLEAACAKAGVKRYTAHHLRHTFATTCLRNCVDVRTLQQWLGHADLATTMKYLHALQAEDGLPDVPAPL